MSTLPGFLARTRVMGVQFFQSLRTRLFSSRTRSITKKESGDIATDERDSGNVSMSSNRNYIQLREGPKFGAVGDHSSEATLIVGSP